MKFRWPSIFKEKKEDYRRKCAFKDCTRFASYGTKLICSSTPFVVTDHNVNNDVFYCMTHMIQILSETTEDMQKWLTENPEEEIK